MYNRYIPQPDGTYRRNHVQEPQQPKRQPQHKPVPSAPQPCAQESEKKMPPQNRPLRDQKQPSTQEQSIGSFLKQLLPRDLDAGDLLVIVLLLLMAGDCQEDRNHALLTLVLYLFL